VRKGGSNKGGDNIGITHFKVLLRTESLTHYRRGLSHAIKGGGGGTKNPNRYANLRHKKRPNTDVSKSKKRAVSNFQRKTESNERLGVGIAVDTGGKTEGKKGVGGEFHYKEDKSLYLYGLDLRGCT